jgi:hypothetical protein
MMVFLIIPDIYLIHVYLHVSLSMLEEGSVGSFKVRLKTDTVD